MELLCDSLKQEKMNYQPEEILELLKASYNFQTQFDPEVDFGQELTFKTTIEDWRIICDLLPSNDLAKLYHGEYELTKPLSELELLLNNERRNTLGDFCKYISENAVKEIINPITLLGKECQEAAIFKTLLSKLSKKGVDIKGIRPSSKFLPFFKNNYNELLSVTNKLAPGSLSVFEYEPNKISKTGGLIILSSLIFVTAFSIIWNFHWYLFIPTGIGLIINTIGNKLKPAKDIIGGYDTMRDLILGMKEKINK